MTSRVPILCKFYPGRLQEVLARAQTSGIDFDEQVDRLLQVALGAPPPATEDDDLADAIARASALEPGTVFTLNADSASARRLYSRDEWKRLSLRPDFKPTVFGRRFGLAVRERGIASAGEKTSDNKLCYRRL